MPALWFLIKAWLVSQAVSALGQVGSGTQEKTPGAAAVGPPQAAWCLNLGRVKIEYYPRDRRAQEPLNDSEDLRQIEEEWERFNGPQPRGVFVERVPGGIQ